MSLWGVLWAGLVPGPGERTARLSTEAGAQNAGLPLGPSQTEGDTLLDPLASPAISAPFTSVRNIGPGSFHEGLDSVSRSSLLGANASHARRRVLGPARRGSALPSTLSYTSHSQLIHTESDEQGPLLRPAAGSGWLRLSIEVFHGMLWF